MRVERKGFIRLRTPNSSLLQDIHFDNFQIWRMVQIIKSRKTDLVGQNLWYIENTFRRGSWRRCLLLDD